MHIDTRRRIDEARDILVGKVPDPKSQVEQITIALTYKFMDDMDKETIELGGKATFFTGEFEKYSWSNIFDPKLGGFDLINLYSEALTKLNQNSNMPQLFRDLFKNAFLPYRDPETLKSFLKVINGFRYDHSENLGDAYEYLLSVLSSQGDAGQFRTPRNIIDFIVKIIDPKKNETILDPACGTAGFLISSYRHILQQNTINASGDHLTPDDRQRLINNIVGYDISPDMVRLSLMNMYLHLFQNPKIYEYDTLTSEERWQENYDVILANPPFMTPKGGIRPHKRFSIQAKRSEVLFVDYIMEHLNSNGRAGVIVPEGIVFQSQNAYKDLRKQLVDTNYLYAVVSLPAGIFNPYSGVKTSILLMDRAFAKQKDEILFVKINNDGYDLGAQRREIIGSDIPEVIKIIKDYMRGEDISDNVLVTMANKKDIAEQDYILVGERYKRTVATNSNYPMVELCDEQYFKIESGGTPSTTVEAYWDENVKWVTLSDLPQENFITEITDTERHISEKGLQNSSAKLLPEGTVLISSRATIGRIAIAKTQLATNQGFKNIIIKDESIVKSKYVAFIVSGLVPRMVELASGGTFKEISKSNIGILKIPLPPMHVQEEIVKEIEGYQKIIDGAKQVVENYKPTIKIDPSWEMIKLGDACSITSSKRIFQDEYVETGIPFYRTKEIVELSRGNSITTELYISKEKYEEIKRNFDIPRIGDILISAVGTIGISWVIPDDKAFYFKDGNLLWIRPSEKVNSSFLKIILDIFVQQNKDALVNGVAYNALTIIKLKQVKVPIPSIDAQEQIIQQINEEMSIVEHNKRLIEIFEQKVKDRVAEVWGE